MIDNNAKIGNNICDIYVWIFTMKPDIFLLTQVTLLKVINVHMLFLQFRQEYLDTLYRYAKFQYECGNYSGAAEYLYFFRVLVSLQFSSLTLNTINNVCWVPCTSSLLTCFNCPHLYSPLKHFSDIKISHHIMFPSLLWFLWLHAKETLRNNWMWKADIIVCSILRTSFVLGV